MIKIPFLTLTTTFLFLNSAFASEVWKINSIHPKTPSAEIALKMNLPSETQVDHPVFKITIPKGWSCSQAVDAEAETLTCTPTEDIEKSLTYFSLSRKFGLTVRTPDQNFEFLSRKSAKTTTRRTLNGHEWAVMTLQEKSDEKKLKRWTGFGVQNKMLYVVLAAAPKNELKKLEPEIESILQSVTLK